MTNSTKRDYIGPCVGHRFRRVPVHFTCSLVILLCFNYTRLPFEHQHCLGDEMRRRVCARFCGNNRAIWTSATTRDIGLITPHQLRAARVMLGWSRQRLAGASNTTENFIKIYEEKGRIARINLRQLNFNALESVEATFSEHGIEFVAENGEARWRVLGSAEPHLSTTRQIE